MGRIIMVVTVWLVMAAMMLLIAIPVLADAEGQPPGPPTTSGDTDQASGSIVDHTDQGPCVRHFGGGAALGKTTGPGCEEVT